MNTLYYGDNLSVLRNEIQHESIDLVYLDPPFNSRQDYNVLFRSTSGEDSQAQIQAFDDTWHWGAQAERAFDEVLAGWNSDAAELLRALRAFLKENDMMAYLCMMAVRLLKLRRVLKRTGSIYLHCDPTAAHYLKLLMDAIFGAQCYRNEITWKRTSAQGGRERVEIGPRTASGNSATDDARQRNGMVGKSRRVGAAAGVYASGEVLRMAFDALFATQSGA